PSWGASPPTTRTSPNSTISPGWPLTLSTRMTSSAATRYCFPPVLMTANIFRPRVRSRCSDRFRTGFFQSVCCLFLRAYRALEKARGPKGPRAMLMAGNCGACQENLRRPAAALIPGVSLRFRSSLAFGLRVVVGPGARFAFCAGLHKAVSDAQFGDQNLRGVRMRLDLLAQLADEDAQIMSVVNVDRPPDLLEQVLVGDDVARVLRKDLQQAIFLRRQG